MLDADFAETYERQGYYFPVTVLEPEEAAQYRQNYQAAERQVAGDESKLRVLRQYPWFVLPMIHELTAHPVIVRHVTRILGPDVLVWGADFFVKEANTPSFVSWHQDLNYWGLSDAHEVTVWLALSEASIESGCMRFLPGSHHRGNVEHTDTFDADNLLSRGQKILGVDDATGVDVVLATGQASLHHGLLFHASGPNASPERRLGLAMRFIKPSMRQTNGSRPPALLIRGEDRFGHFELTPPPKTSLAEGNFADAIEAIRLLDEIAYAGAEGAGRRLSTSPE